jgi:beta-glucosidase
VGSNEDTNKEGWADTTLGDRDSLDLVGRQNDLVKAVVDAGKPYHCDADQTRAALG